MNSLPFRKRVQNYNFFLNWQNISTIFFEVFFKWLEISILLTPEVDKNLSPPSLEGGTGGEEIRFPLTPEGGTYNESYHGFSRISQIFYVCVIVLLRLARIFIRLSPYLSEESTELWLTVISYFSKKIHISPT